MNSRDIARVFLYLKNLPQADRLVDSFISYLKRKNLSHLFPSILEKMRILEEEIPSEETLLVENPFPLSEEEKKTFQEIFHSEQVKVKKDSSLIGGAEFMKDGVIYHGSVKSRINKLEERLAQDNEAI